MLIQPNQYLLDTFLFRCRCPLFVALTENGQRTDRVDIVRNAPNHDKKQAPMRLFCSFGADNLPLDSENLDNPPTTTPAIRPARQRDCPRSAHRKSGFGNRKAARALAECRVSVGRAARAHSARPSPPEAGGGRARALQWAGSFLGPAELKPKFF